MSTDKTAKNPGLPNAADVVIVGGGVMGAATAFYLAQAGVRDVLLLERDALGSGGTGRSMAILRMHYSNEVTVRMAHESRLVIADFERVVGAPSGFVKTGYVLLVAPEQATALRKNVALGRSLGVDARSLSPGEGAGVLPAGFALDGVGAVAFEPDSGYADSSAVTNGFASAARRSGARIALGVGVRSVLVRNGKATGVDTTSGPVNARVVVLVAGAGTPDLLRGVGADLPVSFVRHQVVKLHRPLDRLPTHPTIADVPGCLSFRPDSGDLTLVGIREDPVDSADYVRTVDTEVALEAMDAVAHRLGPMADAGWDGGWAGLFDVTPDWHPVIDHVPGVEGLVCGVGFSGHGFKLSPTVGHTLAELVVHGETRMIDMRALRFTRFEEGELLRSAYGGTVFA